jgi:hypothetical protein
MAPNSLTLAKARTRRRNLWWVEPMLVVLGLGSFIIYATWAAFQNAHYYVEPYLSPFYSPCISANCRKVSLPMIGEGESDYVISVLPMVAKILKASVSLSATAPA